MIPPEAIARYWKIHALAFDLSVADNERNNALKALQALEAKYPGIDRNTRHQEAPPPPPPRQGPPPPPDYGKIWEGLGVDEALQRLGKDIVNQFTNTAGATMSEWIRQSADTSGGRSRDTLELLDEVLSEKDAVTVNRQKTVTITLLAEEIEAIDTASGWGLFGIALRDRIATLLVHRRR